MLDLLSRNIEWLFSGIGVVALTFIGKFMWQRFHPAARPTASSPSTSNSQDAKAAPERSLYTAATLDRAFVTRRVRVGDYYELVRDSSRKIRLTVQSLETMEVPSADRAEPNRVLGAVVKVDLGGAVARNARNVKELGVNLFWLPQSSHGESENSVFHFHNDPRFSQFVRICVEHINPVAAEVELSVVHIIGLTGEAAYA